MFDALLNSKFYARSKQAIKCVRARLEPIRRKKVAMVRFLRKDIADLLAAGHHVPAFARMDELVAEMNQASCYDMIDQFCEYLKKQLKVLQQQRECPQDAQEAVATIIFAAARYPDLPELCDLRQLFTEQYGSHFDAFVSSEFIWKLQNKAFCNEEKVGIMQDVAQEFTIKFDPRVFLQNLSGISDSVGEAKNNGSSKNVARSLSTGVGRMEDVPKEQIFKRVNLLDLQKQEQPMVRKDAITGHQEQKHVNRIGDVAKNSQKDTIWDSLPPSDTRAKRTENEIKVEEKNSAASLDRKLHAKKSQKDTIWDSSPPSNTRAEGTKNEIKVEENNSAASRDRRLHAREREGIGWVSEEKLNKLVPPPYIRENGAAKNKRLVQNEIESDKLEGAEPSNRNVGHVLPDPKLKGIKSLKEGRDLFLDDSAARHLNRAGAMIPPYTKQKTNDPTVQNSYSQQNISDLGKDEFLTAPPLYDRPRPTSVRRKNLRPPAGEYSDKFLADEITISHDGYAEKGGHSRPKPSDNSVVDHARAKSSSINGSKSSNSSLIDDDDDYLNMGAVADGVKDWHRTPNRQQRSKKSYLEYDDDRKSHHRVQPISADNDTFGDDRKDLQRSPSNWGRVKNNHIARDDGDYSWKGHLVVDITPPNRASHAHNDDDYDLKYHTAQPSVSDRDAVGDHINDLHRAEPTSRRRPKNSGSGYNRDDYHLKDHREYVGDRDPFAEDGRNLHQKPSSQCKHPKNAFQDNGEDDDARTAIYYGKLLSRTSSERKTHGARKTSSTEDGNGDPEEKMVDQLLLHYSRKGAGSDPSKFGRKARPPQAELTDRNKNTRIPCHQVEPYGVPDRTVSLPAEPSTSVDDPRKFTARAISLEPDIEARAHPKLPDFDSLAARISALNDPNRRS